MHYKSKIIIIPKDRYSQYNASPNILVFFIPGDIQNEVLHLKGLSDKNPALRKSKKGAPSRKSRNMKFSRFVKEDWSQEA